MKMKKSLDKGVASRRSVAFPGALVNAEKGRSLSAVLLAVAFVIVLCALAILVGERPQTNCLHLQAGCYR